MKWFKNAILIILSVVMLLITAIWIVTLSIGISIAETESGAPLDLWLMWFFSYTGGTFLAALPIWFVSDDGEKSRKIRQVIVCLIYYFINAFPFLLAFIL